MNKAFKTINPDFRIVFFTNHKLQFKINLSKKVTLY